MRVGSVNKGCNIGPFAVEAIVKMVKENQALQSLDLWGLPFLDIFPPISPPSHHIISLGNRLGQGSVKKITHAIHKYRSLQHYDLLGLTALSAFQVFFSSHHVV